MMRNKALAIILIMAAFSLALLAGLQLYHQLQAFPTLPDLVQIPAANRPVESTEDVARASLTALPTATHPAPASTPTLPPYPAVQVTLTEAIAPQPPVRFIVVGDSRGADNGVSSAILGEIVQAALDERVNFLLFTGDLVNGSSEAEILRSQLTYWREIMQPLYDAGIGVYPVRGNHDAGSQAVWNEVFSGPYALPANGPKGEFGVTYSFEYGNVFVVGLDQYARLHQVNLDWLAEQLAANRQPVVFAFGHEPAFKASHPDVLDELPDARNAFWQILASGGARIYFAGHDHLYDHARIDDGDGNPANDLHQIIIGGGGAPLVSASAYDGDNGPWKPVRVFGDVSFGYGLVEVNGLNVTVTWKRRVAADDFQPGGDILTYSEGAPVYIPLIAN